LGKWTRRVWAVVKIGRRRFLVKTFQHLAYSVLNFNNLEDLITVFHIENWHLRQ
jgi:hypothetical protein